MKHYEQKAFHSNQFLLYLVQELNTGPAFSLDKSSKFVPRVSLSRLSDHNLLYTAYSIIFALCAVLPCRYWTIIPIQSIDSLFFLFSSFDTHTHIVLGHIAEWIGKRVFFCFNCSATLYRKPNVLAGPILAVSLRNREKWKKKTFKKRSPEAPPNLIKWRHYNWSVKIKRTTGVINETFSRQIDSWIIRIQIVVQTCKYMPRSENVCMFNLG